MQPGAGSTGSSYTHMDPFPVRHLPYSAGLAVRHIRMQEYAQGICRCLQNGTHAHALSSQAHKPATYISMCTCLRNWDEDTHVHSGKHSTTCVHTLNPPGSAPPKLPSHSAPAPMLMAPIFSESSSSTIQQPHFSEKAEQPGGVGLSPKPGLPYRSRRYFRYSEQSCWVPGLNQGVQDAERKFSGEMAGR